MSQLKPETKTVVVMGSMDTKAIRRPWPSVLYSKSGGPVGQIAYRPNRI